MEAAKQRQNLNEVTSFAGETKATSFTLCGDCHSHATKWPVYSKVAPVSWLVQYDVDEGGDAALDLYFAQTSNQAFTRRKSTVHTGTQSNLWR